MLGFKIKSISKGVRILKYKQYPSRSAKRNYFPLPNEIFSLGLSTGEVATYPYLMRCEDRETYQCYPSYETIGEAIGKTKNTVMKYVHGLEESISSTWSRLRSGVRVARNEMERCLLPFVLSRKQSGIMWSSRCGKTSEKSSKNRWHNPM